jgi:monofunctional biosynthetic peptidoglycan transglycosylase
LTGTGKKKGNLFNRFSRFLAKIVFLLFFISLLQVFVLRFINPPTTVPILLLRARNLFSSEYYVIPKFEWRSIKHISPNLIKAVLASEDQRFMYHSGFDFREIDRAVRELLIERRIRGASTITMQMARSVFLWKTRSIPRKLIEAYYTVLIEFVMPKIRILELYLNTVDWGYGVVGAEAASKKYFHKSASELSVREASLMAAILPSPHTWSPVNPNRHVLERQRRIIKSMNRMHL